MTIPATGFRFEVSQITMLTPANGSIVGTGNFVPVWATGSSTAMPIDRIHFQLQLATDVNFAAIVEDLKSWITPNLFDVETSPGVWTAFTVTGMGFANLGKNVRCHPVTNTPNAYFWRVRVEQFV
jgi:hypothetical protein